MALISKTLGAYHCKTKGMTLFKYERRGTSQTPEVEQRERGQINRSSFIGAVTLLSAFGQV